MAQVQKSLALVSEMCRVRRYLNVIAYFKDKRPSRSAAVRGPRDAVC